jgi:hypothetical protein
MEYTFEKVYGEQGYQVRLNGEFVMYIEDKDSDLVDEVLRDNGYESREAFFKAVTE